MECDGGLRSQTSRRLQEVHRRMGQGFSKTTLHLSQVLHLPSSFFERIIDYGVSKYPERFTIQNCQLSGRREDTGTLSYDLIQKYRGPRSSWFPKCSWFFLWRKKDGFDRDGSAQRCSREGRILGAVAW